jgi:glycosyltransferase involved in cell wall biosynthesis
LIFLKIFFIADGQLETDNYPLVNKGASVQTWEMCRELAKIGHQVTIFRRSIIPGKKVVEGVNIVGFKINMKLTDSMPYLSHISKILSSMLFSLRCLKEITKEPPEYLCLIYRNSGFFLENLKIPTVYIMHSPDGLDFYKSYSIYANPLNSVLFYFKKILENNIIKNSSCVIVLNSYIEKYLFSQGVKNVELISNGVTVQNFSNNGDHNYILYAGRFDWNKNVFSLVKAFSKIAHSYSNFSLQLVGGGDQEEIIRAFLKEKNIESRVKIYPWISREEVLEKMSECSVFVLPSFFEVSPNVLLEAMSSEKPVVAKVNIGTIDIISHGQNGYLYHTEKELEEYLRLLLSDESLRRTIGRNAEKTMTLKFNFPLIAKKYENVFRCILP